jgi:hypothetical protein
MTLNPKQTGLALGLFAAILHAAWAILVALGVAKPLMNWAIRLHFIADQHAVDPFSIGNALMLVVFAFIMAFIVGYVFANIWNWTAKKVK